MVDEEESVEESWVLQSCPSSPYTRTGVAAMDVDRVACCFNNGPM